MILNFMNRFQLTLKEKTIGNQSKLSTDTITCYELILHGFMFACFSLGGVGVGPTELVAADMCHDAVQNC